MPGIIGADALNDRQVNFAGYLSAIQERLEAGMAEQMGTVEELSFEYPGEGAVTAAPFTDPLASMNEWPNGGTVDRKKTGSILRSVDVRPKTWNHAIVTPIRDLDNDRTGVLKKRVDSQASVVPRHYLEIVARALRNAFTVNGFDGVPPISATHPITGVATVNNNASALNLDATNLEVAFQAFAAMRSPAGEIGLDGALLPMGSTPTHLIVGEYNRSTAMSLVEAAIGTAGATNINMGRLKIVVLDSFSNLGTLGDFSKYWMLVDLGNTGGKPVVRVTNRGPEITSNFPFDRRVAEAGISLEDEAAVTHYGLLWGSTGT